MLEVRLANDRGQTHLDWLTSYHTFSFSHYYDANQIGFSDLLVINDDVIAADRGFGMHPHQDMEIFSYVLEGALAHKDSMGNGSTIYPGDIQMMSAGTGVYHSEFNPQPDASMQLLQIWIVPNKKGVTPRYQQVHFSDEEKQGQLRLVISPEGESGSLSVYQDIRVYAGLFDGEQQATLPIDGRYVYVHVAKGAITVNGQRLNTGDGAKIRAASLLTLSEGQQAEVLVFNMRPNELPSIRN